MLFCFKFLPAEWKPSVSFKLNHITMAIVLWNIKKTTYFSPLSTTCVSSVGSGYNSQRMEILKAGGEKKSV